MSLDRCIVTLEKEGKLTAEQAAEAREIYGRHERRLSGTMSPDAAAAVASEEAVASLERAATLSKVQTLLQLRTQQRIIGDMASYQGRGGSAAAAAALFDHFEGAAYPNIESRRKVIVGGAHAELVDVLARHRRNLVGAVRHVDELPDVVRELFGEKTGSTNAAEMADAFRTVAERLRQRFNAAGGAIGKLEGWGLPQHHNSRLVREAGFEAWRDFITPRLDRERMIDFATGRPFDDATLEQFLQDRFETIRTDGWIDRLPGGVGAGAKLANRRGEHRVLHFADAESWLSYQERFGDGSPGAPFDAMMAHVEGMARDIAHMEILGPSPAATVRWLKDGLTRQAAIDPKAGAGLIDGMRSGAKRIDDLYAVTSGALGSPVNATWARRFGTLRALRTAQLLGGAFISATTDAGFQAVTRAYNGLPVTGALTGYLKLFRPVMTEDQRVAIRLGLIGEEASKLGAGQHRYLGESVSAEWSRRLADGVLRVSGLSPWTSAGKWAFGMEFLGTLADHAERSFDALPGPLRGSLQRYGIDAGGWDAIRSSEIYEHRGASFVNTAAIADRDVADRLMGMVLTETDFAVPSSSVRARAMVSVDRPGTFWGEASRNTFLFKGFGVSLLLTHGARMMAQHGNWNRAAYAAGLTVTMTLLGALVVQVKEIANGRDPLPMFDAPETNKDGELRGGFWTRAMFQGGGFGIFGDLVAAGSSDRVGSIGEAVGGPILSTAVDAAETLKGNKGASELLRSYTPGGTLWYTRLAYQRLVLDELKRQTDPDYDDAFRRMQRHARDQGTDFWWGPGQSQPSRAPNIDNAFTTPPASAAK